MKQNISSKNPNQAMKISQTKSNKQELSKIKNQIKNKI